MKPDIDIGVNPSGGEICAYCNCNPTPARFRITGYNAEVYFTCYMHVEYALDDAKSQHFHNIHTEIALQINELIETTPERFKNGFEYPQREVGVDTYDISSDKFYSPRRCMCRCSDCVYCKGNTDNE